jgi:8-oxo-dGTP diphosphatase
MEESRRHSGMTAANAARIHVAAGIIQDEAGRILVTERPADKSFAGAWEFPGGKLLPGETRFAGLARELEEELGVQIEAARPLIRYLHRHPEVQVDLDAWRVTRWRGHPHGREGQALAWHCPEDLLGIGLLPADAVIVDAIRLPPTLLVTPPANGDDAACMDSIEAVASTCPLICLRRPGLEPRALLELAAGAACRLEGTNARLLLHGDPARLAPLLLDPPAMLRGRLGEALAGLHSPARYLPRLSTRPIPQGFWFGASCHSVAELQAALAVDADYVFLGPVKPTASHPGEPGLGWDRFAAMVSDLPVPVYAIGGLSPADLEAAWNAGAQGIAAIRGLWR